MGQLDVTVNLKFRRSKRSKNTPAKKKKKIFVCERKEDGKRHFPTKEMKKKGREKKKERMLKMKKN